MYGRTVNNDLVNTEISVLHLLSDLILKGNMPNAILRMKGDWGFYN
jgi:hypothetical protein